MNYCKLVVKKKKKKNLNYRTNTFFLEMDWMDSDHADVWLVVPFCDKCVFWLVIWCSAKGVWNQGCQWSPACGWVSWVSRRSITTVAFDIQSSSVVMCWSVWNYADFSLCYEWQSAFNPSQLCHVLNPGSVELLQSLTMIYDLHCFVSPY